MRALTGNGIWNLVLALSEHQIPLETYGAPRQHRWKEVCTFGNYFIEGYMHMWWLVSLNPYAI